MQHFSAANSELGVCSSLLDTSNFANSNSASMPQEYSENVHASNMMLNNQLKLNNSSKNEDRIIQNGFKKQKKSRVLFSQWQINELEKLFKKQKYVTSNERELMAKRLKLQANQVKHLVKIVLIN